MPGRFALIVATDEYNDPKLSRLRTPATDASALAEVLGDPGIGAFDVQLAVNEPDHMLRRRIAAFFSDRRRDDLLLLHFSCHGLKDDGGQLHFATTDTEVAYLDASAIPAEFVSRQMAISRSNSVLMLLDCCYSGAIARGLRFRAGDRVDVEDHLGGHGRAIITASSAMEYAFEGDELTGEGQPSVFTAAVVKALETGEADRDQDHWISVRELYDYVCDEVREVTPHQRPNLLSHLEGELYVARSRFVAAVTLPNELLDALANPLASVRVGAVGALDELLRGPDAAMAAAARDRLTEVAAGDDSRRVTSAAREALATTGATAPSTLPALAAVPKPPEARAAAPVVQHDDAPPVAAAEPPPPPAPQETPARAATRPRTARARAAWVDGHVAWLAVSGLALVLSSTVLDWAWHENLDYIGHGGQYTFLEKAMLVDVLVTGLAALVLAAFARARPVRAGAWEVVLLLAGSVPGLAVGIAEVNGQLGAGFYTGVAASLVAVGAAAVGARRARAAARADPTLVRVVAGLGMLLAIFAIVKWGDSIDKSGAFVAPLLVTVVLGAALMAKPLRLQGLLLAAGGAFVVAMVLYVNGAKGLLIAVAGGIAMAVAGLLAGEPSRDAGGSQPV